MSSRTLYLTQSLYSLLRYQVEHSKRYSISMRTHILSSMYNAGHELACYQVENGEWARGQNSDIKEVLQAAEWRSGNGIPGVVVTMRSRAKNLQHFSAYNCLFSSLVGGCYCYIHRMMRMVGGPSHRMIQAELASL